MADVLEQQNSDQEATDLFQANIEITCVLSQLVASERGLEDIREPIREHIASFGPAPDGSLGKALLSHVESILTADKGTKVSAPDWGDEEIEREADKGTILLILEVSKGLIQEYAELGGLERDAILEKLQLMFAADAG